MSYYIVELQGKQFKVEPPSRLTVDRLEGKIGDTVSVDHVLLVVDGSQRKLGTPYISGLALQAKIVDQVRGKKIRVATYKSKSRSRKVKGHRQYQTILEFSSITPSKAKSSAKPATKSSTSSKSSTSTTKSTVKPIQK